MSRWCESQVVGMDSGLPWECGSREDLGKGVMKVGRGCGAAGSCLVTPGSGDFREAIVGLSGTACEDPPVGFARSVLGCGWSWGPGRLGKGLIPQICPLQL